MVPPPLPLHQQLPNFNSTLWYIYSHSLQLRQAKLSFPQTHLIVGVFPDADRGKHNLLPLRPHVERCEIVRHCRWVDEVVPDAPWALDEDYLKRRKIDYVAVEEGSTGMLDYVSGISVHLDQVL